MSHTGDLRTIGTDCVEKLRPQVVDSVAPVTVKKSGLKAELRRDLIPPLIEIVGVRPFAKEGFEVAKET